MTVPRDRALVIAVFGVTSGVALVAAGVGALDLSIALIVALTCVGGICLAVAF